jgi:hypothetical protein
VTTAQQLLDIARSQIGLKERCVPTNSARRWALQLGFERFYERPPTEQEMREIMARTKAPKSKDAKAADEVGNIDQTARWRKYLDDNNIALNIPKPSMVERDSIELRRQLLFARLERPDGVARDIQRVAEFGPEVLSPTAHRCAEGLGFTPVEIEDYVALYRDTELQLVRDALEPSARLYKPRRFCARRTQSSMPSLVSVSARCPRSRCPTCLRRSEDSASLSTLISTEQCGPCAAKTASCTSSASPVVARHPLSSQQCKPYAVPVWSMRSWSSPLLANVQPKRVGVLVRLSAEMSAEGIDFLLYGVSAKLARIFRLTGLETLLP